jgi:Spy/CpxP family protein refolding chaperone
MDLRKLAVGVVALALASSAVKVIADDAKPAGDAKPHMKHRERLAAPWNMLTDLTDDQKAKIADIHQKELDEEKKLKDQEKADITALLTDDQKKELDEALAKAEAEKKAALEARHAKAAQEKADEMKDKADHLPTTAPSGTDAPK